MIVNNKDLVGSIAINNDQNKYTKIDIDGTRPIDSINLGSIILLQASLQKAKKGLVKQKAIMTPEQLQRLQACVKEISAILHEQTTAKEQR